MASYRLHPKARIVLAGESLFGPDPDGRYKDRTHTQAAHRLLEALGIPHVYRPDMAYRHHWNSGWFGPLAEELVKLSRNPPPGP